MISIVVPVLNEAESLPALHAELADTAHKHGLELEIIYVDDGSADGSWQRIRELVSGGVVSSEATPSTTHHSPLTTQGIRLRRNFGKAAALSAGVKAAHGTVICTLDADLQDDPAELPRFLAELERGLDVVSGWKKERHDPWHKVWPSRVFNRLVSWLTGVKLHDHNCGFKAYRAAVFKEIRLYGELHRFIPVLAAARGYKVGEIVIQHWPRKFGRSKYGTRRFIKGFLDLLTVKFLTGFGNRPQHFLGTISVLASLAGLTGMAYLAVIWVLRLWWPDEFDPIHTRPLLTYSAAALIVGVQMMSIGFLAELLTAYQGRDADAYSVAERTDDRET
jgi:glycosyltransferase involved in cell wall biosynthesis